MAQISKQFQLMFQEQIILTVTIFSKFGQLHPLPALIGRHIHHSRLLADFLSQICIVNTVLLQKKKLLLEIKLASKLPGKCTKSWILEILESASNSLASNKS